MSAFQSAVCMKDDRELERFSAVRGNMSKMCTGAVEWLLSENAVAADAELRLMCRLGKPRLSAALKRHPRSLCALVSMVGNRYALAALKRLLNVDGFADACALSGIAATVTKPPLHAQTPMFEEALPVAVAEKLTDEKDAKRTFREQVTGTHDGMSMTMGMAAKGNLWAYQFVMDGGKQPHTTAWADRLLGTESGLRAATAAGRQNCVGLFWLAQQASDLLGVRLYVRLSAENWTDGGSASNCLDVLAKARHAMWDRIQQDAMEKMLRLYNQYVIAPIFAEFKRNQPRACFLCEMAVVVGGGAGGGAGGGGAQGTAAEALKELSKHALRGKRIHQESRHDVRDMVPTIERRINNNVKRMQKAFKTLKDASEGRKERLRCPVERAILAGCRSAPPPEPVELPQPISLHEYLGRRVRPRIGCARCDVATGPDPRPRLGFLRDGAGRRGAINNSAKRACPFADHAVVVRRDLMPLVGEYDKVYRAVHTNKRAAVEDFMKERYGVVPLGGSGARVTMYELTRVKAVVCVRAGQACLALSPVCLAAVGRWQGVYAGFELAP